MSEKKIIAVVGATGAQGGGLVRAIMSDPNSDFIARALTRDVNSDKAKALADLGAEVVAADVNNVDSLIKTFEGTYGAFCVTFFWDHFSPEKEKEHAKAMADAAADAGVKHVVWSTLEDTRKWVPLNDNRMPTLMEKYKVPHFDAKGEADAYFTERGLPLTLLHTTFYWDNLIYFGMGPKRGEDGKLALNMPLSDKKLSGIGAEDIGKCAYGIFKKGTEYIGKSVGIAGEHLSGSEMANALSKALNEEVVYNMIPHDVYRNLGFPGAEDLGNMFQFYCDFESHFESTRDLKTARDLNPDLQTFNAWLSQNKERIPLE